MLFTAPAFMFVFLPFSLLFCVLFAKHRGKLCLGIVSMVYYVLLYAESPLNLCWLLLWVLYAYFAGRMVRLGKKRIINIFLGSVPLIWLVFMRALALSDGAFSYPLGLTFPTLCVAAYVWDIANGDGKCLYIRDVWLYVTFFPLMLIGPFLTSSEFVSLTDEDNMSITVERCSSGLSLFAVGFIKRIAIGATLVDGYEKILSYSWESPNLIIILLLLILIYFGVFFSVSGYYDMAVGVCRMYGINVPIQYANPFTVATLNEYSKALLANMRKWTDRYIVRPIAQGSERRLMRVMSIVAPCACTLLILRTDAVAMLLVLPLSLFALISAATRLDKSHGGGRPWLRIIMGIITVLTVGAFWALLTVERDSVLLLDYISKISIVGGEYQTDMVLISFSMLKYATLILMGLLLLLPQTRRLRKIYDRMGERAAAVVDYASLALLAGMFLFAVMFFLPQYSFYNNSLFKYILI